MSQIPEDSTTPEQWAPPDPFKDAPVATNETMSPPATSNTADASIFASLPAPATDDVYNDDELEPEKVSRRARPKPDRKAKAPKPPKAPAQKKSRGGSPASNQELVTVVPVSTSFDLLEGGYQKVIKARIGIMALAGVFVLVAIVLVGIGLRASSSNSANQAQYLALVASTGAANSKVGADTNYNGYSGTSLRQDLSYRAPLVATAASSALNTTELLEDINSLAGPGISITGISIAPTAAATAASTTTTTTNPDAPAPPTTVPAPAGTAITISVIATNYTNLSNFVQQLEQKYPFLQSVAFTQTGATPSLNASITATVLSLPYPVPPVVAEALHQTPPVPTTTIVGATTTTTGTP